MLNKDYKKLSITEKILLVEDIWDSIAEDNAKIPLSSAQKKLLDERLTSLESSPKRMQWDEIKRKVKSGKRKR